MHKLTFAAAVLSLSGTAAVQAQTLPDNVSFQYVMTGDQLSVSGARAGEATPMVMLGASSLGGKVVAGRPFLGTEERHSLQVLGDGTRLETTETDKIYRDEKGRTRVERDNGKLVNIQDPVTGMSAELNTVDKTFRKSLFRATYQVRTSTAPSTGSASADAVRKQAAEASAATMVYRMSPDDAVNAGGVATMTRTNSFTVSTSGPGADAKVLTEELGNKLMAEAAATGAVASVAKTPRADLGAKMVNGIMAQGSRSTLVIPVGQIGNDRPINVVGEQWYSNDLQMMVKSSNSDPRFGDTTYQLTGVVQVSPDPSLFLIPSDYTSANLTFAPRASAGK